MSGWGGSRASRWAPKSEENKPATPAEPLQSRSPSKVNETGPSPIHSPGISKMINEESEAPSTISIRRAETSLFPQLSRDVSENTRPGVNMASFAEEDEEANQESGKVTPSASSATTTPTAHTNDSSPTTSPQQNQLKPVPISLTPRPKTSVRWNKRIVVISIPLDARYYDGTLPQPLTKQEVDQKFARYGEQFGVWQSKEDVGFVGMSKESYPPEDWVHYRPQDKKYTIKMTDKNEWEQYVNLLREEKLRALGVDLGGGDPVGSMSPTPSHGRVSIPLEAQLGKNTPPIYPSHTFSPPPQTHSAGSHRNLHARAFSVSPIQMSSPLNSSAQPFVPSHVVRQSMSIARTPPMYGGWDPNGIQQQPTPPMYAGSGGWSPQFGARNSPGMFQSLSPQPQLNGGNAATNMFMRHQHRPSQQWQTLHSQMTQQMTQQQDAETLRLKAEQDRILEQLTNPQPFVPQQAPPAQVASSFQQRTLEAVNESEEPEEPVATVATQVQEREQPPLVTPVPRHGMNRLSVNLQKDIQGHEREVAAEEKAAVEPIEEPSDESEKEAVQSPVAAAEPEPAVEAAVEARIEEEEQRAEEKIEEEEVQATQKESLAEELEHAEEVAGAEEAEETESVAHHEVAEDVPEIKETKQDLPVAVEEDLPIPVEIPAEKEVEQHVPLQEHHVQDLAENLAEKEVVQPQPQEQQHLSVPEDALSPMPPSPEPMEDIVPYPAQPRMPEMEEDVHLHSQIQDEDSGNESDPTQPHNYHDRSFSQISGHSSRLPAFLQNSQYHSRHTSYQDQQAQPIRLAQEFSPIDPMDHTAIGMLNAGHMLSAELAGQMNLGDDLSEDARTNLSDIHTNPSEPPSPSRGYAQPVQQDWNAAPQQHAFTSAGPTKFNAEAAEFRFGGGADEFNFTPAFNSPPAFRCRPTLEGTPQQQHTRVGSGSGFNVSAPVFTPSGFVPPATQQTPQTPQTPFNFSSNGSFDPEVPTFTPSKWVPPLEPVADPIFSSPFQYRDIADEDPEEIIMPPPRTKAIPIIKPASEPGEDAEDGDDSRGPTREEGRAKKAFVKSTDQDEEDSGIPLLQQMAMEKEIRDKEHREELEQKMEAHYKFLANPFNVPLPVEELSDDEYDDDLEDDHPRFESYTGNEADIRREQEEDGKYVFKVPAERSSFAMARPTSPWAKPQKKDAFGIIDVDDFHFRDMSVDQAQYAAAAVSLPEPREVHLNKVSPPPPPADETIPDVPPVKKGLSAAAPAFNPAAAEFNFEFTAPPSLERKASVPNRSPQPGLLTSKYSPRMSPSPPPPEPAPKPPMNERLPVLPKPAADELNETFNFMFTTGQREGDSLEPGRADTPYSRKMASDASHRSNAPSPSPRRMDQFMPHRPASFSPDEDEGARIAQRLAEEHRRPSNIPDVQGDDEDSDWDNMVEGDQEDRLHRSAFFDNQVEGLVGGLLERRLNPVERSLHAIHEALQDFSPRRRSRQREEDVQSDADDEDDEEEHVLQFDGRSPRRGSRKLERMRSVVREALAAERETWAQQQNNNATREEAILEIKQALRDLTEQQKALAAQRLAVTADEERRSVSREQDHSDAIAKAESAEVRFNALSMAFEDSQRRLDDEERMRREAQEHAFELERRLKAAAEEAEKARIEAEQQKELAEERDRRLRVVEDKRHQTQMRTSLLEGAHSSLQKNISELTGQNAKLQGMLAEAEAHNSKGKKEIESLEEENKRLRHAIESLEAGIAESRRLHEASAARHDHLQEQVAKATTEIEDKQARWREKGANLRKRIELLEARLDSELKVKDALEDEINRLGREEKNAVRLKVELEHMAKMKEKLELECERMREDEREAIRLQIELDQSRRDNYRLEELTVRLRNEMIEHERRAAALKQDVESARESARDQVNRVTMSLQQDIENANNQVNAVRANLEQEIDNLRSEIDRVVLDADTAKERHKMQIDELEESKQAAIKEQHRRYELQLEDLKNQSERALNNATEDAQRENDFLSERLSLAHANSQGMKEKISILESQLDIAKKAAQAAAQAARNATSSTPQPQTQDMSRENSVALAPKVSTQALRESLAVLQEQLQERESRIEQLEAQAAKQEALKDQDHEVMFLRELLGVRVGELEDIVNQLGKSSFDRNAVRNAAIRLKANLQMEQQERERTRQLGASVERGSTSTAVTSTAASAAGAVSGMAAAFAKGALGGLRKTKAKYDDPNYVSVASPSASSPQLGYYSSSNASNVSLNSNSQTTPTPSRPNTSQSTTSASGFLTGLLTPPTGLMGRVVAKPSTTLPQDRFVLHTQNQHVKPKQAQQQTQQKSFAYDDDAESGSVLSGGFYDEDHVEEGSVIGTPRAKHGRVASQVSNDSFGDEDDEEGSMPPGFARSSPYMRR